MLTLPSSFFSLELNEKLAAHVVNKNNENSVEKNGRSNVRDDKR